MNRKKLHLVLLLLCALALFTAGCGQRGPLYLPEPGQETPAEDESEEKNEQAPGIGYDR
jgi:predicted small lipoprotein YifL